MTTAAVVPPVSEPVTPPSPPPATPPASGPPPAPPAVVTPPASPPAVPPAAAATPPAAEPVPPAEAPVASKVPEKYALVVSAQGQAHVSARDLVALESLARASNWSNDDAQQALDEHIALAEAEAAANLATTVSDPDYGGANLQRTEQLVARAIDLIRPVGHPRRESFLRFINRAGALKNIDATSFLADLAAKAAEDSPVGGSAGGNVLAGAAEKLYAKRLTPPTE